MLLLLLLLPQTIDQQPRTHRLAQQLRQAGCHRGQPELVLGAGLWAALQQSQFKQTQLSRWVGDVKASVQRSYRSDRNPRVVAADASRLLPAECAFC